MRRVGALPIGSGKLVVSDGTDGWGDDFLEVPAGTYEFWIEYGRPSRPSRFFSTVIDRIVGANAQLELEMGDVVAQVGVDSGKLFLADYDDLVRCWEDKGPMRVGKVRVTGDSPTPAQLVRKRFGLEVESITLFGEGKLKEEVSESLEAEITEYLASFPEYERNTFFYFSVYTHSTFDRFNFYGKPFGMLPIDSAATAKMAMTNTAFGDGCYPISIHRDGTRCTIEVSFRGTYTEDFVSEHFSG